MVRAICIATKQKWHKVHMDLCKLSGEMCTMPSANWLWGLYLKKLGFRRMTIAESCPECMTVDDFCNAYPEGVYIICTGSHAVAAIGGNYYDAWDSGDEVVEYIFMMTGRKK